MPTPFGVDEEHAVGAVDVIIKNDNVIIFLEFHIDAAAWCLNIVGFTQNIAIGLAKQLKKMKKDF
jgi:hypothetical protein